MSNLVTFPHDLTLRNRDLVLIAGIGEQYGDRFVTIVFEDALFMITGASAKCKDDVLSILRIPEHGYRTRIDVNLRVAQIGYLVTCEVDVHSKHPYRLPTGARPIQDIKGVSFHEASEFEYTLCPKVTRV